MRDGGRIDQFVLWESGQSTAKDQRRWGHTGTFFCDSTTAQSVPRTPTDVMFAAVIALNAYSVHHCKPRETVMLDGCRDVARIAKKECDIMTSMSVRTDLI